MTKENMTGENQYSGKGEGDSGAHGHHHHRHRHGIKYRIKRWLIRHKWVGVAAVVGALVIAAAGLWMLKNAKSQGRYQVVSGRQVDVRGGYREINYRGKTYRYNNRITSILYIGLDSEEPLEAYEQYTVAPRADSISLVVMDEFHKRITIMALNRDTMTPIRKYTLNGRDRGLFVDHLGYAFTYGDGGKASCDNLCEAVSNLLGGIPINGYVVTNRASLPMIADAIGPVEVTVPNNDLLNLGYAAGTVVDIDATNLETFVRSRDVTEDFSNTGRMARQQAYIDGAIGKIMDYLTESPSSAWNVIEEAEDCLQTNITRRRYLDLTKVLKNTRYSSGDYYIPEGEQAAEADHDVFYPDEDRLRDKVIELFYFEQ